MPRPTPPGVMDPSAQAEAEANAATRAIALVDPMARVRAVSSAFASTLHIRRDELLGRPLTNVVRAADRPALAHAIGAVATGEWPGCSIEVFVEQHARQPRTIRFVLESDGAGRVRLIANDLSAEREAQRTREEYEQSLKALTQHSLDIWALVGAQGIVRSMSDSVAVHLGWLPGEMEG
ncbi:MAG: PAS domain-containing protein, partial [Gemmatimonadaceae bacterium]|nr:PAS domain-containing protein [Gemmatimonadaceae bacterium]